MGASPITFLKHLKDALDSIVHLTSLSFFSISMINFTISAKFEINILKKFIFPKNNLIYFLFLGIFIVSIDSTLFWSILIPFIDTIWPKSLPSYIA
jgi:hypothetical protein